MQTFIKLRSTILPQPLLSKAEPVVLFDLTRHQLQLQLSLPALSPCPPTMAGARTQAQLGPPPNWQRQREQGPARESRGREEAEETQPTEQVWVKTEEEEEVVEVVEERGWGVGGGAGGGGRGGGGGAAECL